MNKKELVLTCTELAEIIIHPQKSNQLSVFLKEKLTQFGLSIEEEFPTNDDKNMQYTIKANHHGSVAKKPLFFVCSIDSSINTNQLKLHKNQTDSSKTSSLPPENGSSVVVLLEVIRFIKEQELPTGPIEFIFTFSDHNRNTGESFDISMIDSKFGYILDSFSSLGNDVTKCPFIYTFEVNVTKAMTFSNLMKENDCSALDIVNMVLDQIPTGQIDKETYVTIEPIINSGKDPVLERHISISGQISSTSNRSAHLFLHKVNTSFQQLCKEMELFYEMDIHKVTTGFHLADSSLPVSTVKKALRKIKQPFLAQTSKENCLASLFNALGKETLNLSIGPEEMQQETEDDNSIEELLNATKLILLLIEKTPK